MVDNFPLASQGSPLQLTYNYFVGHQSYIHALQMSLINSGSPGCPLDIMSRHCLQFSSKDNFVTDPLSKVVIFSIVSIFSFIFLELYTGILTIYSSDALNA